MMQRAYSVFDNKALIYSPPFFTSTNGSAVRMLEDLANDPNTQVGRHPGDFVLYCVGHYDDSNAALTPYAPLEHVVDAIALLRIEKQLPLNLVASNG